jgi:hypothetical protein
MRLALLTLTLTFAPFSLASAEDGPNARVAFVERRGLLEADAQCRLLTPSVRDALNVGALQARGALLRAGWSNVQTHDLEQTVISAARARPCSDARTVAAATQARASFGQWANAGTMAFPGWERVWVARRSAEGWRLSQRIDTPINATFGVRQDREGRQQLVLEIPVARGATAPQSARLVLRDSARVPLREISLTQRMAGGLSSGAPDPVTARGFDGVRTGERNNTAFIFPDAAFNAMLALDPRETVELRVQTGRASQRLFVEISDIAAARAFLTIRR